MTKSTTGIWETQKMIAFKCFTLETVAILSFVLVSIFSTEIDA